MLGGASQQVSSLQHESNAVFSHLENSQHGSGLLAGTFGRQGNYLSSRMQGTHCDKSGALRIVCFDELGGYLMRGLVGPWDNARVVGCSALLLEMRGISEL